MHLAAGLRYPVVQLQLAIVAILAFLLFKAFNAPVLYFLREMNAPENNYGYLLLALGAFVVWRRLPLLMRHHSGPSWVGTACVAAAVALMLLGELGFMTRLSYGAFFLVLAGFTIAYFGRASILMLIAPLAAFALAAPVPGHLAIQLSTALQQVSSVLGAEMLRLLGIAVFQNGNIIDLGVYQLQVAEACSGLRYLFPLMIIAIFVVWLARAPWWGKVVTLLAVVPLTIVLNSFRIAMTGVLVNYSGIEAAQGFMHYFEGWLVFVVSLLVLASMVCMSTWLAYGIAHPADVLDFDRIEGHAIAQRLPASDQHLPSPFAKPLLAGLLVLTVGALVAQPLADRAQTIPERPNLWTFPLTIDTYHGTLRTVDGQTRQALGSTDELLVDYAAPDEVNPVNLWVAYYATQTQGAAIHSPKECLPGAGWEYEKLRRREIDVASVGDDRPFRVNEAIVVNGAERIVMVYWIDGRGRRLASEFMNKIYNLYDTIVLGRSDAALVRVITSVAATETDAAALDRVYRFVDRAYPHLETFIGAD